jgi:hypothetical protein
MLAPFFFAQCNNKDSVNLSSNKTRNKQLFELPRKTQNLTEGGFSYPPGLNSNGGSENPPSVERQTS